MVGRQLAVSDVAADLARIPSAAWPEVRAQATATFTDGRHFTESGDATPDNVHFDVRPHFARLALTRAKARALRDALNISMCSVEELQ